MRKTGSRQSAAAQAPPTAEALLQAILQQYEGYNIPETCRITKADIVNAAAMDAEQSQLKRYVFK
jgi:hypothetical protein